MDPRGGNSINHDPSSAILRRNDCNPILLDQNHLQQHQIHKDPNPDPDLANGSNSAPPPLSGVQEATAVINNGRMFPVVRYRDCLKNHAASIGGHAVDGCGEFMPGGEEGTPSALTCAACRCHRNFHRKEEREESDGNGGYPVNSYLTPPSRHPFLTVHPYYSGFTAANRSTSTAPVMMNFSRDGGATAESSSEDLNLFHSNITGETSNSNKKRFRTIFTNSQKEKMHDFAEKVGWKIQRQDEEQVHQFCKEVDIKRQVFKVWMHNNRQAMKKKEL